MLTAPYFSPKGKIRFMVWSRSWYSISAGRADLQYYTTWTNVWHHFFSSISEGKIRIQVQQTNSEPDLWKLWNLLHKRAISTTYSRVHKSSDSFFSKILEKPSIVQKKMIPHIKGLDFSQRWSKKKFKMADLENSKWPPQKNLIFQLRQFSIFFHENFMD